MGQRNFQERNHKGKERKKKRMAHITLTRRVFVNILKLELKGLDSIPGFCYTRSTAF